MTSAADALCAMAMANEFAAFVEQNGLGNVKALLLENDIDSIRALQGCTETNFREIGLKIGSIAKIRVGLQELKDTKTAVSSLAVAKASAPRRRLRSKCSLAIRQPPGIDGFRHGSSYHLRFCASHSHSASSVLTEPKRPASAYHVYVSQQFRKEINSKKLRDVIKVQAERWKTLPASEKSKYQKAAADLQSQYKQDMKSFKEAGGFVGHKRAENKDKKAATAEKLARREADADRPKQPPSGAYGLYRSKYFAETWQSLPAGSSRGAWFSIVSARWKALNEDEKIVYEKEYQELVAKYKVAMKTWKEAKGASAGAVVDEDEVEHEDNDRSPKEGSKTTAPKKHGRPGKSTGKNAETSLPPPSPVAVRVVPIVNSAVAEGDVGTTGTSFDTGMDSMLDAADDILNAMGD